MIKKIILIGLLLTLCVFSQAKINAVDGGDVGNGGDVVECPGGYPFAHRLLDFYEAGVLNSTFVMDLGGPAVSVENKVQMYLDRLKKVSPVRSLNYKVAVDKFFSSILWLQGQELQDIQDSAHLILPVQCKIRQLAIRLPDQRVPGKKYLINQDIWNQLDNDQKAGLVMHEIIYEEAVQNGDRNSIKARKINAWIASHEFANVTPLEFSNTMLKNGLPSYEMISGYDRLYLYQISYHANGSPQYGYTSHTSWIPLLGGQWIEIAPSTMVEFHKNGRIKMLHNTYQLLRNGYDVVINGNRFASSGKYVTTLDFFENGMVKELTSSDKSSIEVASSVGPLHLDFNRVRFNESGTLKYANLMKPLTIQTSLSPDTLSLICIGFDSAGELNSGCLTQPARMRYAGGYLSPLKTTPDNYQNTYDASFRTGPNGFLSETYTDDVIAYTKNSQSILLSQRLYFDEFGEIQAGDVVGNQFLNIFGVQVPLLEGSRFNSLSDTAYVEIDRYRFFSAPNDFTCVPGDNGDFFLWPNQTLQGCEIAKGSSVYLFGKQYLAKAGDLNWLELFPDSKIKGVVLYSQYIEVVIRGEKYSVYENVDLHANGVPSYIASTAAEYTFTSQSGKRITLPKNSEASFDQNGFLIEK